MPIQTLADLRSDVLSRVNLPTNTPAGQLGPGTGQAPLISTADTIDQYLNEAVSEACRTFYPLRRTATFPVPAGTRYLHVSGLVATDGAVMWAVRTLSYDGATLTHTRQSAVEFWNPSYLTDAAGTPVDWYDVGDDQIGLRPVPSQDARVLTGDGLFIPAPMVEDDDPAPFAPDLNRLLVFHACARLAEKNTQDSSLAARAAEWKGEWTAQANQRLTVLWRRDPDLAAAHYPPMPSSS